MKRNIHAVTRSNFQYELYFAGLSKGAGVWMCRTGWLVFRSSGGDSSVMTTARGQNLSPFECHGGPPHHMSSSFNCPAFTPLERYSAGFSSPGQCFHCAVVVWVCISVTRLQMNVFHLLGLLRIQLSTTVASVHSVAFL